MKTYIAMNLLEKSNVHLKTDNLSNYFNIENISYKVSEDDGNIN